MPRPEGLRYARPTCQIPLRSGWPSWVRGAGAVRLGLPSLVRGVPGRGILIHWAWVWVVKERKRKRITLVMEATRFIWGLLWRDYRTGDPVQIGNRNSILRN